MAGNTVSSLNFLIHAPTYATASAGQNTSRLVYSNANRYVFIVSALTFCLRTQCVATNVCPELPRCRCDKEITNMNCSYGQYTFIPKIPDTAIQLHLDHNILTKIPSRVFSRLSKVRSLYLNNNKIRAIAPFAFEGMRSLNTLDLRINKINIVSSNSFANIPRLQTLTLSINKIQHVTENVFGGTSSLVTVELDRNRLRAIPSVGYQPELRQLRLPYNVIDNATFPNSYRNGTKELTINLAQNKLVELQNLSFSSLDGVTVPDLILSNNYITSVNTGAFEGPSSIKSLKLRNNPINNLVLRNIAVEIANKSLIYLDLTGVRHEVQNSVTYFGNKSLERLRMSRNSISFIEDSTFVDFTLLKWLDLDRNSISEFRENTLKGFKRLLGLNLADNIFKFFPAFLPASLQVLDLTRNKLRQIKSSEINYLTSIQKLVLRENNIHHIGWAFKSLFSIQIIDLTLNRLHTIDLASFKALNNFTNLYASGNSLRVIKGSSDHPLSIRVLYLANNTFSYFPINVFQSMIDLKILRLEGNNLGYHYAGKYGWQLFKGLQKIEEIQLSNNNIEKLSNAIFKDQVSLKILKMDHNKISGWGPHLFKHTKNLTSLDVSHNLIPSFKEADVHNLNNLDALYLEGNPFICNCDLLWFRDWMDRTAVMLPKKQRYTCHGPDEWRGKPVLDFTSDKINCSPFPTFEVVGSVSATLVVSVVLVIIVYRKRWSLRLRFYLLSKRGQSFLSKLRSNDPAANYGAINEDQDVYDAYISCSEYDNAWVLGHLLPGIDNGRYDDNNIFGGDFKLYFDNRDCEPGASNVANIFEHMTKSRKVIVVLSRDYYNGITEFELDQATTLYHDHDLEDIIVIKVGDVPARRIPPHLYTQMRNGNFIEWEDDENAIQTFKEKLKERLRKTTEHADLCCD